MPKSAGMSEPRIVGIVGWSGQGKTTLMVGLIRHLTEQRLRVSTIKHAHHGFDIDVPGKDSHRHREAGASEVLIMSGTRWALMHEVRDEPEPMLADLIGRIAPCDIVLVEGFKSYPIPRIEVHRPSEGKPPIFPGDPLVAAVACDVAIDTGGRPRFDLDDIPAIARFIRDGLPAGAASPAP